MNQYTFPGIFAMPASASFTWKYAANTPFSEFENFQPRSGAPDAVISPGTGEMTPAILLLSGYESDMRVREVRENART